MGDFYNRGGGALTTTTINATTITADDLEVDGGTLSIDETNNRIGVGTTVPGTQLQVEGSAPYVTLKNDTAENTAGGCESKVIFEDHGNNALGQIEVSHVGSSDDEKGQLIIKTNNDSGLQTALTINEAQKVTAAGDVQVTGDIILDDGGSLKEAGGTAAITFDGSGNVTKIGVDSASSGQFLKWNGSKWLPATVSGTVAGSVAADDISAGDAAINLTTTTGNITIDAQGNDTDIIFKGTDGNADTTFLTIDGSAAGAATFNDKIIATELDISGNCDIDGTTNLDNTDIDGTLVVDGSNISLDSTSTLNIDNSNTSNGITIGTATSGVPVSIGHTTSETTVNDNLTVTGDLTVNGTTTTINSTTLTVDDKTVVIASGASDSAAADGAGISIDGASATLTYVHSGTKFAMNKPLDVTGSITSSAAVVAASLDISGDVDVDGTLEADAITVNGSPLAASATTDTTNASNIASGTLNASRMAAAQTAITSILATDVKIGEDDQTKIDFGTANAIEFHADNAKRVTIDSTGLTIGSGAEEDTMLIFDGHSGGADFRIGIDDSTDTLEIGKGTTHATDAIIKIKSSTNLEMMLNSAVADGEVSGTLAMFTADEDLTAGEVVYFKSNGKVAKAVATAAATSRCVAMAIAPTSANALGPFLLKGFARFDSEFPQWTVGGTLFTPEAETDKGGGALVNVPEQTASDTDGDFVQVIGYAISADAIYFDPDSTVIEVA